VDEKHAEFLTRNPVLFLLERFTIGFLPIVLHRVILRPARIWAGIRTGFLFLKNFITSPEFREQWFLNEIAAGEKDGMLTTEERAHLEGVVKDPFIVRYLKCLGVHFATVPITQIVSVICSVPIWAVWLLTKRTFVGRGPRRLRPDGCALSGNADFTRFHLPRRLCGLSDDQRTQPARLHHRRPRFLFKIRRLPRLPAPDDHHLPAPCPLYGQPLGHQYGTHVIPVFGEKGALMEHWIFDSFFNRPQKFAKWAAPRMRWLLDGWMIFGLTVVVLALCLWPQALLGSSEGRGQPDARPRLCCSCFRACLFYPLMTKKQHRAAANADL
jgi:hypothetical protein